MTDPNLPDEKQPVAPSVPKQEKPDEHRERFALEVEKEISSAFSLHDGLREATRSALQSIEIALNQCLALEKKCSSGFGRRFFLGRRLGLKPVLVVLGTARSQLRRSIGQMEAVVRNREVILEEALDPELDH